MTRPEQEGSTPSPHPDLGDGATGDTAFGAPVAGAPSRIGRLIARLKASLAFQVAALLGGGLLFLGGIAQGLQAVGLIGGASPAPIASVDASTARFSSVTRMTSSGGSIEIRVRTQGLTDFRQRRGQSSTTLTVEAESRSVIAFKLRQFDRVLFFLSPTYARQYGQLKWLRINLDSVPPAVRGQLGLFSGGLADPSRVLDDLGAFADLRSDGAFRSFGVRVTKYKGLLDPQKGSSLLSPGDRQTLANLGSDYLVAKKRSRFDFLSMVRAELWIGDDGTLRRVVLLAKDPESLAATSLTQDLWDFGTPAKVAAPPRSSTETPVEIATGRSSSKPDLPTWSGRSPLSPETWRREASSLCSRLAETLKPSSASYTTTPPSIDTASTLILLEFMVAVKNGLSAVPPPRDSLEEVRTLLQQNAGLIGAARAVLATRLLGRRGLEEQSVARLTSQLAGYSASASEAGAPSCGALR